MRRRLNRFLLVLGFLFLLTGFAAQGLWPGMEWFTWLGAAAYFAFMVGWMFAHRSASAEKETVRFLVWVWVGGIAMSLWSVFLPLVLPLSWWLGRVNGARAAFATAAIVAMLGLLQMRIGPKVRRRKIPIAGLPKDLQGLKIAQISDLHVGPTVRRSYVDKVVRRVMALEPDLIAFTGDFGDGRADTLKDHWEPLKNLAAPLGLFYVTGNHEYYWGADSWISAAKQSGFTPLTNEHRLVKRGQATVLVGGVPDPTAAAFGQENMDPMRAAQGGVADFRLLLAHRPDAAAEADRAGFQLQLSGHTHGGQYLPFNFLMPLFHKFYRGLNRQGSLWVYVNTGTAYWGPPNRFGIPSEISLLTLTASEGNG